MFCNQCGMEVPEGGAFCPNCGNKMDNVVQTSEDAGTVIGNQREGQEQGQNMQRKFCPNCGTENSAEDTFCKECGMPLDGRVYGVNAAVAGMQMNGVPTGAESNKRKGLIIGICAAAAVLVLALIVIAVRSLAMSPRGKVFQAVAATMKETPEIVSDLKAVGNILSEDRYTLGFTMEIDGDTVSGEYRNSTSDKQIYLAADVDSDQLDVLCGVHAGVFKAAAMDWDYVFTYDPKRDNDGYLCENMRKKELEQLNSMLESMTSDKADNKALQKELTSALLQESETLEFKEAKPEEFEVDGQDRECKGYKVRINEKNLAHYMEAVGEITAKRMPKDMMDEFTDEMEELIEEIEDDDFDLDITFYLYKKKLAAVTFEMDDYGDEEWVIAFQGGDYRMQNVVISLLYDGETYGEAEISCKKKGSVETISIESDADMTITYDTKSGVVSMEYDDNWSECYIEGIYKHSGSEASFSLEAFEVDGDSLMEEEDVSLMIYVKKGAEIEKYSGTEFDLGGAEEDDFEDLIDDLRENSELFEDWFYEGGHFIGLRNLYW